MLAFKVLRHNRLFGKYKLRLSLLITEPDHKDLYRTLYLTEDLDLNRITTTNDVKQRISKEILKAFYPERLL